MTLRTLLSRELLLFGENYRLADSLLGCKNSGKSSALARWCVSRMLKRSVVPRKDLIRDFEGVYTARQIDGLLYQWNEKDIREIEAADPFAYRNLRKELYAIAPSQPLWDSLIPFAPLHCTELAILAMVKRGMKRIDISAALNVSERRIYEIIKRYGLKSNRKEV